MTLLTLALHLNLARVLSLLRETRWRQGCLLLLLWLLHMRVRVFLPLPSLLKARRGRGR